MAKIVLTKDNVFECTMLVLNIMDAKFSSDSNSDV